MEAARNLSDSGILPFPGWAGAAGRSRVGGPGRRGDGRSRTAAAPPDLCRGAPPPLGPRPRPCPLLAQSGVRPHEKAQVGARVVLEAFRDPLVTRASVRGAGGPGEVAVLPGWRGRSVVCPGFGVRCCKVSGAPLRGHQMNDLDGFFLKGYFTPPYMYVCTHILPIYTYLYVYDYSFVAPSHPLFWLDSFCHREKMQVRLNFSAGGTQNLYSTSRCIPLS